MRKIINEVIQKNKNIKLLHNDLWRFPDAQNHCINLGTYESIMWNIAAGLEDAGTKVFAYSISFFNIGRLESLRAFFGDFEKGKERSLLILNAGEYGYDEFGNEHSFHDFDDCDLMNSLGFAIYTKEDFDEHFRLDKFIQDYIDDPNPRKVYIRLGKDGCLDARDTKINTK